MVIIMGNADDPVQSCPGPCDVVIPIVYSNQPISVPYKSIRDGMTLLQRAAIDEVESVRQTFTRPDANPPLSIYKATSKGVKVLGLGHAGVAFINGVTGAVSYYEYGRYDGPGYGLVRSPYTGTVTFDEMGNPDPNSFASLMAALTKTNYGSGQGFEGVYVKVPNGSYQIMKDFADTRMADIKAKKAAAYDINGNHCFTFALEVAGSVGVNADVSSAEDLEMILINSLTGGRIDAPDGTSIELPSRQVLVLQQRYKQLKIGSSGTVVGNFSFPAGLYSK